MSALPQLADLADNMIRPRIETASPEPQRAFRMPAEIPLFDFSVRGEQKVLQTPLALRVTLEGRRVSVENETLSLFGVGDSLGEAVEELQEDLSYYWEYYNSLSESDVAGRGEQLRNMYRRLAR